jgi:mannosyltransferase OCH1-like enzyme
VIPRILHYVWVGDQPLPAKVQVNIETWLQANPGFEIRAWTNENVPFDNAYLENCRTHRHWANASNYIRLAKIREHGGIYLDTDVMVIRSFNPMLRNKCFLGFQVEDIQKDRVNNAVFGAEPGHWFVDSCIEHLLREFDGAEPANHSSPRMVTKILCEHGLDAYDRRGVTVKDVRVYPRPVFYPFSWTESFSLAAIRRDTVTVHFWDKSWAPEKQHDTRSEDAEKLAAQLSALEIEHQRLIRDALRLKVASTITVRRKQPPRSPQ